MKSQFPYVTNPLGRTGEVLVIAGDEECPMTAGQARQRFGSRAEVGDGSVDEIADDSDQIGLGPVDRVDDPLGVGAAQDGAEVDVADDGDPETVRGPGQLGERDGDPLDARTAEHAVRAVSDGTEPGDGGSAPTARATNRRRDGWVAADGGAGASTTRVAGAAGVPLAGASAGYEPISAASLPAAVLTPCGRTAIHRAAREHPPQNRPYRLAHQQSERQIEERRQPEEARPGQRLLQPEGAPARPETRAPMLSSGSSQAATVPARRSALPGAVVSPTRRRHT